MSLASGKLVIQPARMGEESTTEVEHPAAEDASREPSGWSFAPTSGADLCGLPVGGDGDRALLVGAIHKVPLEL